MTHVERMHALLEALGLYQSMVRSGEDETSVAEQVMAKAQQALAELVRADRLEHEVLEGLIDACHQTSLNHGWYEGTTLPLTCADTIGMKLALIHSEASEALEDVRDGHMAEEFKEQDDDTVKPVGFPSELADVVIRVFDLARACDVKDFAGAIQRKMAFNRTRPYRHGNKAC